MIPKITATFFVLVTAVVASLFTPDFLYGQSQTVTSPPQKPNIVFIVADDLGYGDLGCYGQTKIQTPNIDSLATVGLRLTRHYSGCNVCAPSRAVLMTGLHNGHNPVRDNREIKPEGQFPLTRNVPNLIGELKKRGYVVGAFGKWGLGGPDSDSSPLKFGCDRFFGYNCQRVAHSYYPEFLWDNDKQIQINTNPIPGHGRLLPEDDPTDPASYKKFVGENYSPDLIADQVMKFVSDNQEKPFFLYWPTTVPHLALQVPEDSLKEYIGRWDDPMYEGGRGYTPNFAPRAAYAAMVTRLDREVGRLVRLLKEKNLYENTLIVFTSDNGPLYDQLAGTDSEFFNSHGNLRGRKGSMYEGGVRVPCVITWGNRIKPNTVSDRVTGFEDWMPTFLHVADQKNVHTADTTTVAKSVPFVCDGKDFTPTILGRSQPARPFLYRESPGYGGQQMVISDKWKLIRTGLRPAKNQGKKLSDVPLELYDLTVDPSESQDVAAANPDVVKRLEAILIAEHTPNVDFPMPLVDD